MKRLSKVFSVVFVAAYLILVGCIGSWIISRIANGAWKGKFVYLHLENIPEGTVFADVLAKGDWEEMGNVNTTYEDSLGISGHDCEIARYSKDGYKSLMFNSHFYYQGDKIDPAQPHNVICFKDYFEHFKTLPYIKVAYCDKDGNILGITEEQYIMPVFLREVSYDLFADGDKLSYKTVTGSPFRDREMWFVFIAMPIFGIVYLIRNRLRKKNLIQSGKTAKVFSAVFAAAYLVLVGCISLWIISRITNGASNDTSVDLHLKNMPEGTAFADVLAKGHWEEIYQVHIIYEESLRSSGLDCEIAQYEKDGYKSMMFNTSYSYSRDDIDPSQPDNVINFYAWYNYFEDLPYIKVAYCDKDGNILGITEEKHLMPVFLRNVSYDLYADGDELSYKVGLSPYRDNRMWILFIAMAIFGVVYLIHNRRRKKKLIQSGETDNERKE